MSSMLAQVWTRAELGLSAPAVQVEVHMSNGLPGMTLVGLPASAVRESKDRVRSALLSSGAEYPTRRLTVNLAPADLPKQGGRYDLPMAVGLLAVSGQVPMTRLDQVEWVGELGLDGSIRPVAGILPVALSASTQGRRLVVPHVQLESCAAVPGLDVRGAAHLDQVMAWLRGREDALIQPSRTLSVPLSQAGVSDLAEVRGQAQGKRALEVAAAGGHSLLYVGPPGSGKSMLAARLAGLLPPLPEAQRLEVAAIHSLAGQPIEPVLAGNVKAVQVHNSATAVALIGGRLPGAISLAHRGVLFLDELPEFDRRTLEMLREPLEQGEVRIARAAYQVSYPARCQLVAAMNPSPCGYFADDARCRSTPEQIARYLAKVSGPVLDRIDLQVELAAVEVSDLQGLPMGETSAVVAERVAVVREKALAERGCLNAELSPAQLEHVAQPDAAALQLLSQGIQRLGLSARAYHRVLRVALTLADLDGQDQVRARHVAEAMSMRMLERRLSQLGRG